jgi:pimeloyl-ACP methyl ester carboxylesterase
MTLRATIGETVSAGQTPVVGLGRLAAALGSICCLLILGSCSSPAQDFSQYAFTLGMRRDVVAGTEFQHVVFSHGNRLSRTLHIYVDGDGTPWRAWGPTADPTPRNPLLLRLMARDPNPSLYLGRPCYQGLADSPPCSSTHWTGERYSEAVVTSMAAALHRILAATQPDRLVWFGYSGGGTLATLLAPRFDATTDLITVAANLDTDAWTDLHAYSRLAGSLNPARQPVLPERIRQRHYVGGKDRVVPKEVFARAPIDPASLIVIPSYDHVCCWETLWATLLVELEGVPRSGR